MSKISLVPHDIPGRWNLATIDGRPTLDILDRPSMTILTRAARGGNWSL